MTTTDWIVDIALIAMVLVQLRERRYSWHTIILPLGGVAWAASNYLTAVPTAGNDLALIALFVTTGAALGIAGGLTSRLRRTADGVTRFKASTTSAALWIAGTGGRLAFIVWITHGGATTLAHFSATHDITTAAAWTDALILMVLTEVALRTAIIVGRAHRVRHLPDAPIPAARPALAGAH